MGCVAKMAARSKKRAKESSKKEKSEHVVTKECAALVEVLTAELDIVKV